MSNVSRNIELVFKTNDITKLNKTGYNFVMNMSGFIAHYDLYGFRCEYENVSQLLREIKDSFDISNKSRYITDRFFSEGKDKEYYRAKYDTLAGLEVLCQKYAKELQNA